MLAYLDSLCAALLARKQEEVHRLLKHPLARALPRRVRDEALAIARIGPHGMRAPINTLRFYHQTTHLLGRRSAPGVHRDSADAEASQMELPLRAAVG
ncbi:MAG: hypothetical protein ACRENI_02815 [Gemmatimonadaceae bacterium]